MAQICNQCGKRVDGKYIDSHADWHERGKTTRRSRNERRRNAAEREARKAEQGQPDVDSTSEEAEKESFVKKLFS